MGRSNHIILIILAGLLFILLFSNFYPSDKFYLANISYILFPVIGLLSASILVALIDRSGKEEFTISVSIADLLIFLYSVYIILNMQEIPNISKLLEYTTLVLFYIYFRNIKKTVFLCLSIIVLSGIIQMVSPSRDFVHNEGIYYNTGIFGCFLSLSFIIAFGITFYFHKANKRNYLYIVIALLILISLQLILLKSRTAWIASLAGSCMVIVTFSKYLKECLLEHKTTIVLSIVVSLILLVSSLYLLKKDSADGRFLIWTVSCNIAKQNLITGNGTNSFSSLYMDAQATYIEKHPDSKYRMLADEIVSANNEFIETLVEEGLVGLFAILAIIFILLFKSKIQLHENRIPDIIIFVTIKASLIGLLVIGFFTAALHFYQFRVLCIFFIAYLSMHTRPVFSVNIPTKYTGIAACIIVLSVFSIKQAEEYRNIEKEWWKIKQDPFIGTDERVKAYESMYPTLKKDVSFLSDYAFVLIAKEDYDTAKTILEQAMKIRSSYHLNVQLGKVYKGLGDYNAALNCWNKAAHMIPARFVPLYLIIKLEHELGQTEKARQDAEHFMKKKIKIKNPEIDFMKHEINLMFNFNNY